MELIIKDFIFCDDIRSEEGRKFSVMGIYSDKLRILPREKELAKYRLPLSTFIRFQKLTQEVTHDYAFNIEITFEKVSLAKIEGNLGFGHENFTVLPINKIEFDLEKSGELVFNLTIVSKNSVILKHSESLKIVIEEVIKS